MDDLFNNLFKVVGKLEGQDIINFAGQYMVGNSGQQIRQNRAVTALMHRAFFYYFVEEYSQSVDLFYNTIKLSLEIGLLNVSCTCAIMYSEIMLSKSIYRPASGAEMLLVTIVLTRIKETKSAYLEASLILQEIARNVPKVKRDPKENPFLENKRSPLFFAEQITSNFMPSSNDPDDVKLSIEMAFRDYLRGLMMLGRWRDAILEFSNVHNAEKYPKLREAVLVPAVKNASEIGIRFFHNTNEDNLGAVIKLFEKDAIFVDLGIPSIYLFKTFAIWQEEFVSKNDHLTFSIALWQQTLGTPIQKAYALNGDLINDYQGLSLHEIAQSHRCHTLKVIPHGVLFGLPLSSAGRMENDNIRFAIEDYSIIYYPPWKSPENPEKTTHALPKKALFVSGLSDLVYANAEIDCIKKLFVNEATIFFDGTWHNSSLESLKVFDLIGQIIVACNSVSSIHFSCHGTFSLGDDAGNNIIVNDGHQEYLLKSEDLFTLNLNPDCFVFLNCCNSVSANPSSIIESYTLPVYFLAAQAKNIIATTKTVKDIDSFRIGLRYWQLVSKGNTPVIAFRLAILECINETLPAYIDELEKHGYASLAKEVTYRLNRKKQTFISSWMSYTCWENHS